MKKMSLIKNLFKLFTLLMFVVSILSIVLTNTVESETTLLPNETIVVKQHVNLHNYNN